MTRAPDIAWPLNSSTTRWLFSLGEIGCVPKARTFLHARHGSQPSSRHVLREARSRDEQSVLFTFPRYLFFVFSPRGFPLDVKYQATHWCHSTGSPGEGARDKQSPGRFDWVSSLTHLHVCPSPEVQGLNRARKNPYLSPDLRSP